MNTPTMLRLAAFFEGLARAEPSRLESLAQAAPVCHSGKFNDGENLWKAAAYRELQSRYAAIVASFDVDLLMDIARGELDVGAVAKHVLGAIKEERQHPEVPRPAPPWKALDATLREDLTTVAHRFLRFKSLDRPEGSEAAFKELSFIEVREALVYAYFMGYEAA